jgi:hypothetical protein
VAPNKVARFFGGFASQDESCKAALLGKPAVAPEHCECYARKKKQSGWLVEPAPDCAPWECSALYLRWVREVIGRAGGNLCKTVRVLPGVRIGKAGENRREFHSSTLPIRSILRDVDRSPALGIARTCGERPTRMGASENWLIKQPFLPFLLGAGSF